MITAPIEPSKNPILPKEPETHQGRGLLIIAIVSFLLLLGAIAFFYFRKNSNQVQQANTAQNSVTNQDSVPNQDLVPAQSQIPKITDPTESWPTHEFTSYGFSFRYPKEYTITFQSNSALGLEYKSALQSAIAISVFDARGATSIEKWYQNASSGQTDAEAGATYVMKTYNGIDGLLSTNVGLKKRRNFYFLRSGKVYRIVNTNPDLFPAEYELMLKSLTYK